MKQIKREITTYEVGDGFYVDIVPDVEIEALFEVWLYHKTMSIKTFMFGGCFADLKDISVEEMIEENLSEYDYINQYKKRYMDIPSIINREPKKIFILSTPPATLTDKDLRRDKKIHRIQSMER